MNQVDFSKNWTYSEVFSDITSAILFDYEDVYFLLDAHKFNTNVLTVWTSEIIRRLEHVNVEFELPDEDYDNPVLDQFPAVESDKTRFTLHIRRL